MTDLRALKLAIKIKETWTLFFLFLALTTLLIIITYDTSKTATVVAATSNTTTNTQLKTYTDPAGFFTLQYPVTADDLAILIDVGGKT